MTEEMQLFLEDMNEQLCYMEDALLDLSENSLDDIDKELVNKLFRAMHTMKGNAGIFGYDLIVEFAHLAESLLDEVRNGKIALTYDMLELLLMVKDHSKHLIEVCIHDEQLDEDENQIHQELIEGLSSFLASENKIITTLDNKDSKDEINGNSKEYFIKVKLKDDFFVSGMDMLSIIKYLDAIGEVKNVKINDEQIPDLEELNPIKSYLSLEILYNTEEPISEIEDAFEFVQDDIELDIQIKEQISEVSEEEIQNEPEKEFRVFKKVKKEKKQKDKQEFRVFKKSKKN